MPTFIDGIAASENIDSSGECISVAGLDISSLDKDGVFNYEHELATGPNGEKVAFKLPQMTVGKILKAKKIFSLDDCEDDRQRYFWHKCEVPYIYVMGELFDDYTDAAKDLAGKLRYDADHKEQKGAVINFSIEGNRLGKKEGMMVPRSIGRKVTITVHPCNKAAVAEILPAKPETDELNSIFKTESGFEIELLPSNIAVTPTPKEDMKKHADLLGLEPMQKAILPLKKPLTTSPTMPVKPAPTGPAQPGIPAQTTNPGNELGQTKSGKKIFSHARIHEYHGFSAADHQEAANFHHLAAQGTKNPQAGRHHLDKMKLHMQAAETAEKREGRFAKEKQARVGAILGKSLEAGSAMAAPSNLTQGAALGKEQIHLGKKKKKGLDWLARAEEEYTKWEKREEFRTFMQKRLPHLAMGEIDAIGKTIALKKSLDAEKKLSKLLKK